jgi:diguanylate cyclase (GGDEF)-like protein
LQASRLIHQGDLEQALQVLNKISLISSRDQQSAQVKFKAKTSILNIFIIKRMFDKGIDALNYLLTHLESIDDIITRHNAMQTIAYFYNQLNQYQLGLKYANVLLSEMPEGKNLCMASLLKLEALYRLHQSGRNNSQFKQTLDICEQQKEVIASHVIRTFWAEKLIKLNNLGSANKMLKEQLSAVEALNYPTLIASYYSLLAKANYQLKQIETAENFAKKALEILKQDDFSQPVVDSYQVLYQIAKQQERYQQSLTFHEKYMAADKAFIDTNKAKVLAFEQAGHNLAEAEYRLSILQKQNEMEKLANQLAMNTLKKDRYFIAILFFILTIFFIVTIKQKFSHKRRRLFNDYDALTGAFTKNRFTQLALEQLNDAIEEAQPLSLIVFSVDDLDLIRESYSQATADWTLQKTVKRCENIGRSNDIIGRISHNEFAIILSNCDIDITQSYAEKCRIAIEQLSTKSSGHNFQFSASFGISDSNLSGYNLKSLFENAETALEKSRARNGNHITIYAQSKFMINEAINTTSFPLVGNQKPNSLTNNLEETENLKASQQP